MRVERFNNQEMKVNIVIREVVWQVVSCCSPWAGRTVNEKEEFYEIMDKVVTSEKMLVYGCKIKLSNLGRIIF